MGKPKKGPAPAMLEQIERAADELSTVPGDAALEQLTALVDRSGELELRAAALEQELFKAKGEYQSLVADRIPALMDRLGVSDLRTKSGLRVEVKTAHQGTLGAGRDETEADAAERRSKALRWLRQHGHDGIIREELSVDLGKGGGAQAQAIEAYLQQLGVQYDRSESVHPQTLKAFVREQLEATGSHEFPRELFRATSARIATIKRK